MALRPRPADEPLPDDEAFTVEEKARLLAEMDRRIDELAERRVQEIQTERVAEKPE
jgi:hypothetical protein